MIIIIMGPSLKKKSEDHRSVKLSLCIHDFLLLEIKAEFSTSSMLLRHVMITQTGWRLVSVNYCPDELMLCNEHRIDAHLNGTNSYFIRKFPFLFVILLSAIARPRNVNKHLASRFARLHFLL
jgi:hypothetical protein